MSRRTRHNAAPFTLFAFQDIITSVTGIMVLLILILTLELVQRHFDTPAGQTAALLAQLQAAAAETLEEVERLRQQVVAGDDVSRETVAISLRQIRLEQRTVEDDQTRLAEEIRMLQQQQASLEEARAEWIERLAAVAADQEQTQRLQEQTEQLRRKIETLRRGDRVVYHPAMPAGKRAWLVDVSAQQILTAPAAEEFRPLSFPGSRPPASPEAFLRWIAGQRSRSADFFLLLVRPSGIDAAIEVLDWMQKNRFDVGIDLIGETAVVLDPQRGAAP